MKINGLRFWATKDETVRSKETGEMYATGELVEVFLSPDGTRGTMEYFEREVSRGRLHGCTVSF